MTTFISKTILPLSLTGILALTRFDHFGNAVALPDATLAVFFFAGLGSTPRWLTVLLLLEAALIDFVAISEFNVSDFCISPAYVFLIPAYAVMWLGGGYAKAYIGLRFADSLKSLGIAAVSTTLSFFISNASFYLLSQNIANRSASTFADQFIRYYPVYFASALIYIVIGYAIVKLWKAAKLNSLAES